MGIVQTETASSEVNMTAPGADSTETQPQTIMNKMIHMATVCVLTLASAKAGGGACKPKNV